jgi:hypothetical protein
MILDQSRRVNCGIVDVDTVERRAMLASMPR